MYEPGVIGASLNIAMPFASVTASLGVFGPAWRTVTPESGVPLSWSSAHTRMLAASVFATRTVSTTANTNWDWYSPLVRRK